MKRQGTTYTLKKHLLTIRNGNMYGLARKGIRHIIGSTASKHTHRIRFVNVTAPRYLDQLFAHMPNLTSIDMSGLHAKHINSSKNLFYGDKQLDRIKLNSTLRFTHRLQRKFEKWYPTNRFVKSAVKLDDGKTHSGSWQLQPKTFKTAVKFIDNNNHHVLKTVIVKDVPEDKRINVQKCLKPSWHFSLVKNQHYLNANGRNQKVAVFVKSQQHHWGKAKCDFNNATKSVLVHDGQITRTLPTFMKQAKVISFNQAIAPANMRSLFSNLPHLVTFNGIGLNTANTTNMRDLFKDDHQLTNVSLIGWDGINLTDARGMFANDNHLFSVNLKSLDTLPAKKQHHLTDMFKNTKNLHYLQLDHNTCLDSSVGLPTHWYMTQYIQPTTNLMDGQSHIGTWRLTPTHIKTPLCYVDGVNFISLHNISSIENMIVQVGKHPVGLPKGYHVFNPDAKVILSGHSQNIQVVKNKVTPSAKSVSKPSNTASSKSNYLAKSADMSFIKSNSNSVASSSYSSNSLHIASQSSNQSYSSMSSNTLSSSTSSSNSASSSSSNDDTGSISNNQMFTL